MYEQTASFKKCIMAKHSGIILIKFFFYVKTQVDDAVEIKVIVCKSAGSVFADL